MKFWALVFGSFLGLWLVIKTAKEDFEGMAYWIGAMLLTAVATICHAAGYDTGADSMEKGFIVRGSDNKFYPTVDNPVIKQMTTPPRD